LYPFFFVFFSRRRVRSTLSALRLSKLSRRDETPIKPLGADSLFLFFCLPRALGSLIVWDKGDQKGAPLAVNTWTVL
jgi:hypothetical protein